MEKKQARVVAEGLTPDSQKKTAIDMALAGFTGRAFAAKDKKYAEKLQMILAVMDKHGLDEKASKTLAIKGERPTKAESEAILKTLKDPVAFVVDYAAASFATAGTSEGEKPKLEDLKIDGNKATGNTVSKEKVKVKVKEGDKVVEKIQERVIKSPVAFEKINNSWRIDPDVEVPEDAPKDKDKKKDK